MNNPIRIAILQRVCTGYRTPVFLKLSMSHDFSVKLFIGDDLPNSKVKGVVNLDGINFKKLTTRFIKFFSYVFPWHKNLIKELKTFDPDVILCEGESHFIGYIQAIIYRLLFNRRVGLIHWCYIALPGVDTVKSPARHLIKGFFRRFFHAFLVYSSFSRDALLTFGEPKEKIFVATNVGNTSKFLNLGESSLGSKLDFKIKLNLPPCFTVMYLGTFEQNKRPALMLDLAMVADKNKYNFVMLGSGAMFAELISRVKQDNLANVYFPGQVTEDLADYLAAADVLLVPGRGGIVVSEAMAFGLPVIVHRADGTEYDLIQNGTTGLHLNTGSLEEFYTAIELLRKDPSLCFEMGHAARNLIKNKYSTENMVDQIKHAAIFVKNSRTI